MMATVKIVRVADKRRDIASKYHTRWIWVSVIMLLLFSMSLADIALWAGAFVYVGAIDDIHKALYFSTVTYTTLGYGDITLGPQWHLLGAFEAANGILMFGWSTALVLAAVQRLYFKD